MLSAINMHIEQVEDGQYLVTSEDVPDLIAQGRTVTEALEIAQDVVRKLCESYIERNLPLPPVFTKQRAFVDLTMPVEIPG